MADESNSMKVIWSSRASKIRFQGEDHVMDDPFDSHEHTV